MRTVYVLRDGPRVLAVAARFQRAAMALARRPAAVQARAVIEPHCLLGGRRG